MKKDLPEIFANIVEKDSNNLYAYSKKEDIIKETIDEIKIKKFQPNINQKIQQIFNSTNYIYKADVLVTTKDGKNTKKIIGKNKNNLITIENELINISDIIDIELIKKK